jgi:hypothetical protein
MDEPPFSLAFVMVKESFVIPARLFYLASDANKNKRPDHLNEREGALQQARQPHQPRPTNAHH